MRSMLRPMIPALLGALCLVPVASAGFKESAPVDVIVNAAAGTGMAFGSIGATRSGGRASAYLGCYVEAQSTAGVSGYCQASDGVDSGSCKLDPFNFEYHLMALRSLTPSSAILFAWNTQNGQRICTYLTVISNSSHSALQ